MALPQELQSGVLSDQETFRSVGALLFRTKNHIPPPHTCRISLVLLYLYHKTESLVRRTAERQTSGSVLYKSLQKIMT